MQTIVECVPNVSEGRDGGKVDQIVHAMLAGAEVHLLDRAMDADHNRSVITIVGTRESIGEAALRGIGKAAELIDLNNRIVERLRFLSQMRAHAKMLQFRIGDRVSFQAEGDRGVIGLLTRYNRKTVTVITDDGRRWIVSPTLLRRADGDRASEDQVPNIVPLRRK